MRMDTINKEEAGDFVLNDKKVIKAWAMFDWANSAYALVITTAVFPIYFSAVVDDEFVFLGRTMRDDALLAYSISFAYIIIAFLLPILSGIADYGGKRLTFMKAFTWLGGLSCISLFFFFGMDYLWVGLAGSILALIGFAGGQVFYNSYLPVIVSEDKFDSVSAKGFSYGYFGSVLLLVVILAMITFHKQLGFANEGMVSRIGFVLVGVWWLGWSQIPFRVLPQNSSKGLDKNLIYRGFNELKLVFISLLKNLNTSLFLISFFFYIAGVMTVISMASVFGIEELNFETAELIQLIILLQLIGALGAWVFSKISNAAGNKVSLVAIILIWTSVCIASYFVASKGQFYFIAATVGLVMGGVQSMSRSTYSKLIPAEEGNTASYFSFFDVLEKTASSVGLFCFGFISDYSGSMRQSILALIIFFMIGLVLLLMVKIPKVKVGDQNLLD